MVAGETEEHVVQSGAPQPMSSTVTPASSRARTASMRAVMRSVTGALIRRVSASTSAVTPQIRPTISAARPSSAASTTMTVSWSPPIMAFSRSGVPSATTRPPSPGAAAITAIWSASRSASSRYCVVSSTVVPPSARIRTASHTSLRPRGSSPLVGSSRKSTAGVRIRLAARSSRRRMPPEYCPAGRLAAPARWNHSKRSSARRAAARPPSP